MSKIMIVDDSPDLVDFLTLLLTMRKFEVETANSKAQIEEKLALFVPDVILLDVKLNGEDGREICRYIKAKTPFKHIPILLLSADPKLLDGYEECEAADIIEKPFDIASLLEKVNNQILS